MYVVVNVSFLTKMKNTKEQKIQLEHPAGKKAIQMDAFKYEVLCQAILGHLGNVDESTHTGILQAINEYFIRNKISFEGSLEWHMEWVKLDLEAKKKIRRFVGKSPITFAII